MLSNEELLLRASREGAIKLHVSFRIMVPTHDRPPKRFQPRWLHGKTIAIRCPSPGRVLKIIQRIADFCVKEFGQDDV